MSDEPNTPPGPGVDASGQAVVDPTKNVLDLVHAEAKRQDDLRDKTSQHTRAIVKLHAKHARDLRKAESARVDALRAGDQAAIKAAADKVDATAATLAATVTAAAEAVRTTLAAALEPIQKDIGDLRRSQWEGVGGKAKVDETHARSGNLGLWIGIAVAVVFGLGTMALSVIVAVVAIANYLSSRA